MESDKINLDSDVSDYVGFSVRNPRFPDTVITLRQLLAHRSSIADGDAYGDSYHCGDPAQSLRDFLSDYLRDAAKEEHFHIWEPGTNPPAGGPRAYSNVAYGLIGLAIEAVSGLSYEEYYKTRIFVPLGMADTGFTLSNIALEKHAVPYTVLPEDFDPQRIRGKFLELSRYTPEQRQVVPGQPWPFCLYSFATPPDGLMRTSIADFARFLTMWSAMGTKTEGSISLLRRETMAMALSDEHFGRKLAWSERTASVGSGRGLPGGAIIYHNGGDPGIGTMAGFRPETGDGFLFAFNRGYDDDFADPLTEVLLQALSD